jgi:hypothetical protein
VEHLCSPRMDQIAIIRPPAEDVNIFDLREIKDAGNDAGGGPDEPLAVLNVAAHHDHRSYGDGECPSVSSLVK